MDIAVGSKVRARGLLWDVIGVEPAGQQTRLRLQCAAGDLRGLHWEILHPFEPVEAEQAPFRPDTPGDLGLWRLRLLADLLEQEPGPDALSSAAPGRIAVEPYQLVPLLRALAMPRPRLLLADGVGLGKTIQAALIAAELIARGRAHRIIIVVPPGPLLAQWEQELRLRFALRFTTIADAPDLRALRRHLEWGGNPFESLALCLTSLDFAKQEPALQELEHAAWDLAIIDEAHHCTADGRGATPRGEDTLRRRLAEVLASRSDGLLLLTATPHDGQDSHFASLMALLDPSLVDGRGGLSGSAYRRHVVRRLKSHIRDPDTGAPLFRERIVTPVRVDVAGPGAALVQRFHQALASLIAPRLRRATADRGLADALAFIGLLKRSVSTLHACTETLRVVAARYADLAERADSAGLRRERARALRALRRRAQRYGVLGADDEAEQAALQAEGMAAELRETGDAVTLRLLQALIRFGEQAAPYDPKLAALAAEIHLIRIGEHDANIIVYTEYADSQAAALRTLAAAPGIGSRILTISGADDEAARSHAAARFAAEDGVILISTDSLAEGLNLHQRCHHLIHLDLPYNPNRLEQRNGRIDRYGQTRDPQIRYLFLSSTFEERLLLHLIGKYEKARTTLTAMPETLGVIAEPGTHTDGLIAGFAEESASLFPDAPSPIRIEHLGKEADADAYRDLLREIDRAYHEFESMAVRHGWLAGQGIQAGVAQLAAAQAARQRAKQGGAAIDLLDFVAAVITAETGLPPMQDNALILPADWADDLDTMPGFDPISRRLRVTRDPRRFHDAHGESLAFLGRAHPLVRRAL